MKVLIVGASPKPDRYAYIAMQELRKNGHKVLLFNPTLDEIEGVPVYQRWEDLPPGIDTVTLYVGPARSEPMVDSILALRPRRIIANPGTETAALKAKAEEAGIEYLESCTIVMSKTGQF